MEPTTAEPELLTPAEVAKLLRVSVITLAKWRSERRQKRNRNALRFTKPGRVLYEKSAVMEFIKARSITPGQPKGRGKSAK